MKSFAEEQFEMELKKFKKAAKEFTKNALKTKQSTIKALVDCGVYTKAGRLRKPYR